MQEKQQTSVEEETRKKTERLMAKMDSLNYGNWCRAMGYIDGVLDTQEFMGILNGLTPKQLQRVKDFVAGLTGKEVS